MRKPGDVPPPGATEQLLRVINDLMPEGLQKMASLATTEPVAEHTTRAVSLAGGEYRLVLFAGPSDPHVLAELLCEVLGEHPLDALIRARQTPGVLPLPMTRAQANELVLLLHGIGMQAAAVRADALPDVANPVLIHHARCRSTGLEVVDLYGAAAEVILWSDLAVIAIGLVAGEASHHYVDAARPTLATAASRPHLDRVDTSGVDAFELWLLRRNPAVAYCINHRQFNYESLGAAATDSAAANFNTFAQTLIDYAAAARRTPSTHAFLKHDDHLAQYAFAAREELQQQALVQWVIGQYTAKANGGL